MKDIGYKVTDEDIRRAVTKYPPRGSAGKHRSRLSEGIMKKVRERCAETAELFEYGPFLL